MTVGIQQLLTMKSSASVICWRYWATMEELTTFHHHLSFLFRSLLFSTGSNKNHALWVPSSHILMLIAYGYGNMQMKPGRWFGQPTSQGQPPTIPRCWETRESSATGAIWFSPRYARGWLLKLTGRETIVDPLSINMHEPFLQHRILLSVYYTHHLIGGTCEISTSHPKYGKIKNMSIKLQTTTTTTLDILVPPLPRRPSPHTTPLTTHHARPRRHPPCVKTFLHLLYVFNEAFDACPKWPPGWPHGWNIGNSMNRIWVGPMSCCCETLGDLPWITNREGARPHHNQQSESKISTNSLKSTNLQFGCVLRKWHVADAGHI